MSFDPIMTSYGPVPFPRLHWWSNRDRWAFRVGLWLTMRNTIDPTLGPPTRAEIQT